MRGVIAILLVAAAADAAPKAKPAEPQANSAPPAPLATAAQALLDRIAKGDVTAEAELDKLAPTVVDGLGGFLQRTHAASLDDRRKALEAIQAAVPDKNGRFKPIERKSAKEEKADDDLDWLAGLAKLDAATPGLGEVMADDAAIRALARTDDLHAAQLMFDTAFRDETIIYRDEIGRYLRKMEPYSIPALTGESQSKDFDRKRYATYQLERLDRQEPGKALAGGAGVEAVTVAILEAFRVTHHREAVHAVWSKVSADSPRVRAKAREAWLAYITGPAPPPAPKKKLMLPGGKLTKKEKPLWLTYRELADNELRKAANELLAEDYPLEDPTLDDSDEEHPGRKKKTVKVDLEDLTRRLFAFYDDQRAKLEATQWEAAKALADKGDLAGATTALDRLLAANPDRANRPAMAKVYLAWAKQLESKQKWDEAAGAYSKAQGLDPAGPGAINALAAHHYTLGKALEARGKDGGPDFRRAITLRPDYAPARSAERDVETAGRPVWMLYTAGGAVLAALVLFGAAMVRRRA